jgi:hypothetical protein
MKTLFKFAIVLTVATFLFSCKKVSDISTTPTTAAFTTGSWSISYFADNGTNRTMDFRNYVLTFYSNGTASANKTGMITNGTWQIDDFDSSNKVDFNFGNTGSLSDLSKAWTVVSIEDTKILLQDNTTHNQQLQLSKI